MTNQFQPKEFSATAAIHVGTAVLGGWQLTAGSDAATAVIREGGAGGTIIATQKAAAGTTAPGFFPPGGMVIKDPHVTLTGTAPSFTVLV